VPRKSDGTRRERSPHLCALIPLPQRSKYRLRACPSPAVRRRLFIAPNGRRVLLWVCEHHAQQVDRERAMHRRIRERLPEYAAEQGVRL
jgi:isocitrate lyase